MVEFIFPSGRPGWLDACRYTVISAKKWSESHISSSSTQHKVYNLGSNTNIHIQNPNIRTQIFEKNEIWLRDKNGKDKLVKFSIPVTEGQNIILLLGNLDEDSSSNGPYIYWSNLNSNEHGIFGNLPIKMFISEEQEKIYKNFYRKSLVAIFFFGGLYIFFQAGFSLASFIMGGLFCSLVGAVILHFGIQRNKNQKITTLRDQLFREIGKISSSFE